MPPADSRYFTSSNIDLMYQSGGKQDSQPVQNVTDNRRSAYYKPNIWKFNFLQSLTSIYDKEEFGRQLGEQVIKVKGLFVQEMDVLQKVELVDWIQKLGLANHFQNEIKESLETVLVSVMKCNNPNADENLYVSALCLRLLRQHGYNVLPHILGNFLEEKCPLMMKHSFVGEVKEVMELLELLQASYLSLEGEYILEEAKTFAINSLKDIPCSTKVDADLVEKVVHALELPSHWRVMWFNVKWHIKQYEKEKHINPDLLALAKLNFNTIQAKLQKELKELSRWWENVGVKKDLNFARNRLVESFMCAAGVAFEPKYKSFRKWLTKVTNMVLVIDDVYDIYASFEELKQFTIAFDRWDAKELEQLPEYMRTCFRALKDIANETAYEIGGEKNFDIVLPYLKKAWTDFCKALYVEAKWYKEGYAPSLEEYLNNACISSSGPLILVHSYFATMHDATDEIEDFLFKNQDLIYNVSLIIRLCNDLGTTVAERERGDAASSIICYMNQMDVSEEEGRKHIQEMIKTAWKNVNGHCFARVAPGKPFLTLATNAARVAHTLYQNGDGFGIQDRDIKEHILSLVVEPFLEV